MLVDYYCFFFFLSWLLASAFPSFLGYRSATTDLAGQEFASGLCGFAFFCLNLSLSFENRPLNCGSTSRAIMGDMANEYQMMEELGCKWKRLLWVGIWQWLTRNQVGVLG